MEEYDEIQNANIFPSAEADDGVGACPLPDSHHSASIEGCPSPIRMTTKTTSTTSTSPSTTAEMSEADKLRQEVEFLRQQLAERDGTVNELHQQIQEDKNAHKKLQAKWDLFFGSVSSGSGSGSGMSTTSYGGNRSTSPTPASSSSSRGGRNNYDSSMDGSSRSLMNVSSHHTPKNNGAGGGPIPTEHKHQLLRLNTAMEKLESEKEACMQKTLKLAVQLAETKAKVSTLESQLDEYKNVILYQNSGAKLAVASVGLGSRFGRNKQVPVPAAERTTDTRADNRMMTEQSEKSYSSTVSFGGISTSTNGLNNSGTSNGGYGGFSFASFPVMDIELTEEDDVDNNSLEDENSQRPMTSVSEQWGSDRRNYNTSGNMSSASSAGSRNRLNSHPHHRQAKTTSDSVNSSGSGRMSPTNTEGLGSRLRGKLGGIWNNHSHNHNKTDNAIPPATVMREEVEECDATSASN